MSKVKLFNKVFKQKPQYSITVPSRANLCGAYTDCFEGPLVTMGIENLVMKSWLAPRKDNKFRLYSANLKKDQAVEFNSTKRHPVQWPQYFQGALAEYQKLTDRKAQGFDLLLDSTIPMGGGLSSSSALAVTGATALSLVNSFVDQDKKKGDKKEVITWIQEQNKKAQPFLESIALTAGRAEWWYGTKGGLMDQFSISLAQKNQAFHFDTRSLTYEFINLPKNITIVVCNTKVPHNQKKSGFSDRRSKAEQGFAIIQKKYPKAKNLRDISFDQLKEFKGKMSDEVYKRTRHIVTEIQDRVPNFAKALESNDPKLAGQKMSGVYHSLKNDFETSCRELDLMYSLASQIDGFYGARITGAGFGGCLIAMVEKTKVKNFIDQVKKQYRADKENQKKGIKGEFIPTVSGRGLEIEEMV